MEKKLYKNSALGKVSGVCQGFAEYFNADVTLVRVAWALLTLVSFGLGFIGYIACMLIMPDKSTLY
ncbi:MAG: PspC domain-containing protein [Clostridium sp.]